ncbi:HNH endonuclease [Actinoplanes sp. NPDC024001]
MDHVIPVALGGRHAIGNLAPACRGCNNSKNDDLLIEWCVRTGGLAKV